MHLGLIDRLVSINRPNMHVLASQLLFSSFGLLLYRLGNLICRWIFVQAKDASAGFGPQAQPGSASTPRTCTRFGTGVLPIITQSLLSATPLAAPMSDSDQPASAATQGLPQSTTLQSDATNMQKSSVQSDSTGEQATPFQSTEALSQSMGQLQKGTASQSMGNDEGSVDNAAGGGDMEDAQSLGDSASEQHVWGASVAQSRGRDLPAADDHVRAVPLQALRKQRGAERAVTPRTLHK